MRLMRSVSGLLTGLLIIAAPSPGNAAMVVGTDILSQWNLVVFGNATATGDVEGRTFIGGNLSGDDARYFRSSGKTPKETEVKSESEVKSEIETKEAAAAAEKGDKGGPIEKRAPALTVVGDVERGRVTIANGGGANIGGDLNTELRLKGDPQTIDVGGNATEQDVGKNEIRSGLGEDFAATLIEQREVMMKDLSRLSSDLSKLDATAKAEVRDRQLMIKAAEGLNIFSLALSDLEKISEISITAAEGTTTVINVSGEAGALAARFADGSTDLGRNVIWNFYEAKQVVFDKAFYGAILAGQADIVTRDALWGSVIAGTLDQEGDIHFASFQGDLSSGGGVVSAMPEPASWAMFILGFGLVGARLRNSWRAAGRVVRKLDEAAIRV